MSDARHRKIRDLLTRQFPGAWGDDPSPANKANVSVLRSTNLDDDGHVDLSTGALRRFSSRELVERRLLDGDILLETSGGGPGKPVGRVALFRQVDDAVYASSNFFRTLRVDRRIADPSFLAWRLNWMHKQPEIWRFQQQTTGIINLRYADYMDSTILLPSLGEQRRIAEILNALDERISTLSAYREKVAIVGREAVRERLEVATRHAASRLDEVAFVDRGRFSARPRNDPSFYGGKYPFIQTGDITRSNGGLIATATQTLNESGLRMSREFPAGTVAVTIAANIGDTAILERPMCFPDSVVGVVPFSSEMPPRFIELYIRRAKPLLEARAPQSAQKNINLQDLRPLLIPIPPLVEQREIAALWDDQNRLVSVARNEEDELRRLRQGLMEDLLTGRVQVSQTEAVLEDL
ncbi:restriction endonuclease subunit S [Herbidospora sp. RD11066]